MHVYEPFILRRWVYSSLLIVFSVSTINTAARFCPKKEKEKNTDKTNTSNADCDGKIMETHNIL